MSKVIGISMMKDERDVVEEVVEHMLTQVDELLVADNLSVDGTREVLYELSRTLPVTVLIDREVGYYQSSKMSSLAASASDMGADWVVPFDADEWWYSPFGRIADVLAAHPELAIIRASLYDHVATPLDPGGLDPFAAIGWRRVEPLPLPKVACRPRPLGAVRIHQGNHDADYGGAADGLLVVRHFPYRSPDQFHSKIRNGAAAYAATDLPEDAGKHWRDYGRLSDEQLDEVFHRWFFSENPTDDPTLIYDPVTALVQ